MDTCLNIPSWEVVWSGSVEFSSLVRVPPHFEVQWRPELGKGHVLPVVILAKAGDHGKD
jgi:hypothetical protein